jgi:hypothetical protein
MKQFAVAAKKPGLVFWLVLFLALNVLDAMITNKAFDLYSAKEVNPIMAHLVGTYAMYFKGVFCLAVIGAEYLLLKRFNIFSRNILRWIPSLTFKQFLIAGCVLLTGVCVWNVIHVGAYLS